MERLVLGSTRKPNGIVETALRIAGNDITAATIVLVSLLVISGKKLLLFAVWFDMESNKTCAKAAPSSGLRPTCRLLATLVQPGRAINGTIAKAAAGLPQARPCTA
jgi:hypothetical protein